MIRQALQRLPTLTDQISAPVKPMCSPHRTRLSQRNGIKP